MGGAGWERAAGVIQPRIWAPHWSDEDLARFLTTPFWTAKRAFPEEAIPSIRMSEPPESPCHIIHYVGDVAHHQPKVWRGDMDRLQTRLLIIQTSEYGRLLAAGLALAIVEAGGPATIVVSGGSPRGLDRYFTDLYANITHNLLLREVVTPVEADDAPVVQAFFGEGADEALQFTRWLGEITSMIERVELGEQFVLNDVASDDVSMLHASQRRRLETKVRERILEMENFEVADVIRDLPRLRRLREEINFAQETKGVLPLNDLAQSAPALEAASRTFEEARHRYPNLARQLTKEAKAMAHTAPRVLNANFADPRNRSLVAPTMALQQDAVYDLLVDVGPRWSRVVSIVKGNDAFPETALPPSHDGWLVKVVFFSDDFVPEQAQADLSPAPMPRIEHESNEFPRVNLPPLSDESPGAYSGGYQRPVASGEIWVPARSGRSHPIVNGKPSDFAGPLQLAMRTPKITSDLPNGVGRGRLSLYYENNLLQSAMVSVNIAHDDNTLIFPWNTIAVDYVLSGDFADLDRVATRALEENAQYPIGINIAMNGDGNGSHRIMIAGHDDLTVTRPYDPEASRKVLRLMRSKLKECFSQHDAACRVPEAEQARRPALDSDNGKSLQELKCDLFQLAWYGSDLYAHAFGQLSSPNLVRYLQRLRTALASRTVIQVARTTHAQYVFPWAMIYDIPLPNRNIAKALKYCNVLDEWDAHGRRNGAPADACPYQDRAEHQQDTLCPYGFWGLKHYIEQPINVIAKSEEKDPPLPRSAASTVPLSNPASFGLGVTRDASLDARQLENHLSAIRRLAACVPDDGADDWADVQLMLAKPDVAYFICHGEYDPQKDAPYLGIGPRGNDAKNRVYPSELLQWAVTQKDFWADRQPLVVINGCHTANLEPGEVLSFVTTFANFGASAVIGTEISIRLPLAAEVGEKLLSRIVQGGEAVGAVMHSLRWELANKGNLLGLAYTPYCRSDLRFQPRV
jgi:hypothetical protein